MNETVDFIYDFANFWVCEWSFGKISYDELKEIIDELGHKVNGEV